MAPASKDEPLDEAAKSLAEFAHAVGSHLAAISALLVRVNVLDALVHLPGTKKTQARATLAALRKRLAEERLDAESRLLALREQVGSLSQQLDLQSSPAGPLSVREHVVLRAAFSRLRLLDPGKQLRNPEDFFTGVQGHSRLFLFHLRAGTRFLAKFDEPVRAAREWAVIGGLRSFNLPPETILPHAENVEEDGVLIYPAAGGHGLGPPRPLAGYLCRCLTTAPGGCRRALELALAPLAFFHDIEPGHFTDRHPQTEHELFWHEFVRDFPTLEQRHALPPVPGLSEQRTLPSRTPPIPDPWGLLPGWLGRPDAPDRKQRGHPIGRVRVSRIHGDLNLGNVLISPQSDRSPVRANLIDLAQSLPEQPAALDFARLELAFGIEVFLPLAAQANVAPEDWIADFVLLQDQLAARTPLTASFRTPFAQPARDWLHALRCQSAQTLTERNPTEAMLEDYFHALFFLALGLLRFDVVREAPPQCWLLLLTASLAAQYLQELDQGAYSAGTRRPPARPVPEMGGTAPLPSVQET